MRDETPVRVLPVLEYSVLEVLQCTLEYLLYIYLEAQQYLEVLPVLRSSPPRSVYSCVIHTAVVHITPEVTTAVPVYLLQYRYKE
jgi:hypothetical protein